MDQQPLTDAGNDFVFLNDEQINMIDEALHSLGDFGEVRLIVEKGRLRFVVTQRSYDAFKWRKGDINTHVAETE